jgi:hypothetical protein
MTIQTIKPYRHDGGWEFDDLAKGIIHEPLVEGIDKMLDVLANVATEDPVDSLTVTFDDDRFDGWQHCLELVMPSRGGGVYRWVGADMSGWLCPCLLEYFPEPPMRIYIRVEVP